MSVSLLSPMIIYIAIPHRDFGSLFLQALHPLFNVVCHCGGPVCLYCSSGVSWLPCLSSIFHNSICKGLTTFLHSAYCHSTWASLLVQLTGWAKQNPTSLLLPRGNPSLNNLHPKNKIASLGARTTASVIHSSRPSWNKLAINEPVHAWEGWGWSPPPSPTVTLTWKQWHIWSSCAGLLHWHSGDKDHSDYGLLCCMKWKGILEKAPICDSVSFNDAISSLKL